MAEVKIDWVQEDELAAVMEMVKSAVAWMQAGGSKQWDETYPNVEVMSNDIAKQQLLGVYCDGVLAGFAAVDYTPHKEYYTVNWQCETDPILIVHRIVVDPNMHGMGLAQRLLGAVKDYAIAQGATAIHTDTHHGNASMAGVFKKCGYVQGAPIILGHKKELGNYYTYELVL
ncbi:GNAT family N-acetyltransferase [Culicoidibacter larvae]|uniref:GNAT family N-acetyltransferase n=1 Tax=Culicoidibacter larvae TaxID=2579976 RepID=A0A5R8QGC1_9FIRM|nr:GNAT family N-acetyltransferase [Culicoidibacter larvae]TLG76760.1 GNAT family N-acetyltransferase [Culicoidibacter larvae]